MQQETRTLAVALTEDELKAISAALARVCVDLGKVEEEKKTANSGFKHRADSLMSQMVVYSDQVNERRKWADVVCYWEPDYENKKMVCTRQDTGEVVEQRDMTKDELQLKLPLASKKSGRKRAENENAQEPEDFIEETIDKN